MSDELILRILEKIQDKISAMDTKLERLDAKIDAVDAKVDEGFAQVKGDVEELRERLVESELKLHTHLGEVLEAMGTALSYRADLATRFTMMERRLAAVEKKLAGGT